MFSSRMVRCSSPRPDTSNTSASAVSTTRSATLLISSRCRRSRIWRLVTNLPSRAGERRGVDLEVHGQRRLVDFQQRQRFGMLGIVGQGDADADFVDAVDRARCRRLRLLDDHALEALEHQHLVRPWRFGRSGLPGRASRSRAGRGGCGRGGCGRCRCGRRSSNNRASRSAAAAAPSGRRASSNGHRDVAKMASNNGFESCLARMHESSGPAQPSSAEA